MCGGRGLYAFLKGAGEKERGVNRGTSTGRIWIGYGFMGDN